MEQRRLIELMDLMEQMKKSRQDIPGHRPDEERA